MQAKLTVTGGKANKSQLSLAVPVIVGRSRAAGLTIAHAMVSRQHCEIFEAGGTLRIRDLGSTNGTYVGGNKVEEAVLRPHDQFTIGPLTFEIDYEFVADSTIVEEGFTDHVGASHAALLSPEAYSFENESPPVVSPSPDSIAETAEPSDSLSEAYAKFAEPSAVAGPAPEGFDFLTAPAEPLGPLVPADSPEEGFEFLERLGAPPELSPADSADVGLAFPGPSVESSVGESEMEPPVEDFESAESAEEFVPAYEGEPPAEYPGAVAPLRDADPVVMMPAEPSAEFAESGPEVPATEFPGIAPPDGHVPDFLAWSERPTASSAAPGVGSTHGAESIPPSEFDLPRDDVPVALPAVPIVPPRGDSDFTSEQVPIWGDFSGSEADGQELSALDSDPNPRETSTGDTQTTPVVPAAPSGKRKTKAGWWFFGRGKADRQP